LGRHVVPSSRRILHSNSENSPRESIWYRFTGRILGNRSWVFSAPCHSSSLM
jgi:hypothetical protein